MTSVPLVPSTPPIAGCVTSAEGYAKPSSAGTRLAAGRLRLPEFEWYLGPMYRRYNEILAERERASNTQVVKKKTTPTVPPEPAYLKHTRVRTPVYAFGEAVYERPLDNMLKAHITLPSPRRKDLTDAKRRGETARKALTPR
eukprot:TRINITY_DN90427_c0_g1_i1.p1 TRINITY_DN90427_c0_g1~~TRINITY_DN90427_c0_g1_i1.p1  ORF type:complete len:142 (+),score=3.27 TRINITY_DN90427_c0_g1_i1:23-448(+)